MILQKATVIAIESDRIWVEAERQSTCGSCQVRQGCGTGLLAKHVGKRFNRIAVPNNKPVTIGELVTVAIPEDALLYGAFLMYLLPLMAMFVGAGLARWLAWPESIQIIAGLSALLAGFFWVASRLKRKNVVIPTQIIEEKI
ncbi:MAG TPA: SoxR reducing system RseC family protein [Methylophaga sp.]|nr:SoxR reducing system RseC family protein [Methylophaga sp.]